jgi:lathosterol oxidase
MDIVLEIFDTFLFDRMYSTVLPTSGLSSFRQLSQNAVSSTLSSLREGATMTPQHTYQPASKILSFQPSDWAYRSAWPRDNIYRQATSLFLITW